MPKLRVQELCLHSPHASVPWCLIRPFHGSGGLKPASDRRGPVRIPGPVCVGFVTVMKRLVQGFFSYPALRCYSVSIIPPMLHTRSVSIIPPMLHTHSVSIIPPMLHTHSVSIISPMLHTRSVSIIPPMLHTHSVSQYHPTNAPYSFCQYHSQMLHTHSVPTDADNFIK
jgi:hypothetical protein